MANVRTVFLSSDKSEHDSEMETFVNSRGDIYIQISNSDDGYSHQNRWICLDVSTAIKFSKTLRTNINKAKEVGNE